MEKKRKYEEISLLEEEKNKKRKYEEIKLSKEQEDVERSVLDGDSIFLTGNAGTGKSFLLHHLIKNLKKKHNEDDVNHVYVTASTGIAALNVNGSTVHSFAGIGLGNDEMDILKKKVLKNKMARGRWERTKVLIIDEISMISGELFSKLESLARIIKKNDKPFGGIQLIICGDFFQLPPVFSKGNALFCFQSKAWDKIIQKSFQLNFQFRQSGDKTFADILNEIRFGKISKEGEKLLLNTRNNEMKIGNGVIPTILYSHRVDVDRKNKEEFEKIKEEIKTFDSRDEGNEIYFVKPEKRCNVVSKLELKKGSQVMLIKNMDFKEKLVNGSVGIVVDFDSDNGDPIINFSGNKTTIGPATFDLLQGDEIIATRIQIPLILSYAITIHKSQGMTLTHMVADVGKSFTFGQTYVALSRAESLDGLQIIGFNKNKIFVSTVVMEFYKKTFC